MRSSHRHPGLIVFCSDGFYRKKFEALAFPGTGCIRSQVNAGEDPGSACTQYLPHMR